MLASRKVFVSRGRGLVVDVVAGRPRPMPIPIPGPIALAHAPHTAATAGRPLGVGGCGGSAEREGGVGCGGVGVGRGRNGIVGVGILEPAGLGQRRRPGRRQDRVAVPAVPGRGVVRRIGKGRDTRIFERTRTVLPALQSPS